MTVQDNKWTEWLPYDNIRNEKYRIFSSGLFQRLPENHRFLKFSSANDWPGLDVMYWIGFGNPGWN